MHKKVWAQIVILLQGASDCYTCNKANYFEGLDIEGLDMHRNQL